MTRRLVLVGQKSASHHTVRETIDTTDVRDPAAVRRAGLLPWFPKPDPRYRSAVHPAEDDPDLWRKQREEGEDL